MPPSIGKETLRKVNDFVDDDLLSCFLWAAGENAIATPSWESPSVNPLKGIPLPPSMPPLPPAVGAGAGLGGGLTKPPSGAMRPPPRPTHFGESGVVGEHHAPHSPFFLLQPRTRN